MIFRTVPVEGELNDIHFSGRSFPAVQFCRESMTVWKNLEDHSG